MTGVTADLRSVGQGLLSRVVRAGQQVRRTTAGPALVRLAAATAALAGLAVAMPAEVLASPRVLFGLPMAAVVGLFPRTRLVTLVALFTIGLWIIVTVAFTDSPVAVWRVAALAAALYAMHASAALAAVLPYDCVVAPGLLLRWAGRTVAVIGASVALGLSGMALAGQLPASPTIIGPAIGSIVAAAVAGLLAWHLRRR